MFFKTVSKLYEYVNLFPISHTVRKRFLSKRLRVNLALSNKKGQGSNVCKYKRYETKEIMRILMLKTISRSLFNNVSSTTLGPTYCGKNILVRNESTDVQRAKTVEELALEEFLDDKENWGKNQIITGRPWRLDELRIKSNSDLHKLWYVLLKERNMLMTMEENCKKYLQPMPCPERYYKVEESMKNLEEVISERNKAYIELETGETGERPSKTFTTVIGFKDKKYLTEHSTPGQMKDKVYEIPYLTDDQHMFRKLYKEKLWQRERDKEDDRKRDEGKHKRWYQY